MHAHQPQGDIKTERLTAGCIVRPDIHRSGHREIAKAVIAIGQNPPRGLHFHRAGNGGCHVVMRARADHAARHVPRLAKGFLPGLGIQPVLEDIGGLDRVETDVIHHVVARHVDQRPGRERFDETGRRDLVGLAQRQTPRRTGRSHIVFLAKDMFDPRPAFPDARLIQRAGVQNAALGRARPVRGPVQRNKHLPCEIVEILLLGGIPIRDVGVGAITGIDLETGEIDR